MVIISSIQPQYSLNSVRLPSVIIKKPYLNIHRKLNTKLHRKHSSRKININALQQFEYETYSEFVDNVKHDVIKNVLILPNKSKIRFEDTDGFYGESTLQVGENLLKTMEEHNVNIAFDYKSEDGFFNNTLISFLLPFILYFLFMRFMFFGGANSLTSNNPFGDSKKEFEVVKDIDIKFDDVAGIDEEKTELQEIVKFLQNPEIFENAGAVIPRGCLLSGPPGIGKTLMAKAVAGEANVPFIAVSASQFIELFVGIGASRIRNLFKIARENSPCIIFIDEIDAIGKSRLNNAGFGGGGNDEREQTLNQLLTEMDGFAKNEGIVVLAATNREDVLDSALLRPGRFDRKISISPPSYEGRLKILEIHSKNKQIEDKDENLILLARKSIGCNGAELMNILNEASILAARNERIHITYDDLEEAFDKITIGLSKKVTLSETTKKVVAYHEAGHALLGALLDNSDDILKVTILPRGNTGGVTQFVPNEDLINGGMYTREYLFNKMIIGFGGRIAEYMVFGKQQVTTGAANDLKVIASIAKNMVEVYGFSDKYTWIKNDEQTGRSNEYLALADIDEVDLINDAERIAKSMLVEHKDKLDKLANRLLEKETITGYEVKEICGL